MVTDVYAHDVIARRIVGFTIDSTPTKRQRSDEEIVEHKHIGRNHKNATKQQTPP